MRRTEAIDRMADEFGVDDETRADWHRYEEHLDSLTPAELREEERMVAEYVGEEE